MKVRKARAQTIGLLLLLAAAYVWTSQSDTAPAAPPQAASQSNARLADAIARRQSNVQVQGKGTVDRLLSDDNDGSRHQRFIVRLDSGDTILIAHNIDLARRVAGLAVGDAIAFSGEYEWTPQGGVIHWTHHDPAGRHTAGWLEHHGQRYQ